MLKLEYKGVTGNRAVAYFPTIKDAQKWVDTRLARGIPISNPKLTEEK